jgi:hypothetical protein
MQIPGRRAANDPEISFNVHSQCKDFANLPPATENISQAFVFTEEKALTNGNWNRQRQKRRQASAPLRCAHLLQRTTGIGKQQKTGKMG